MEKEKKLTLIKHIDIKNMIKLDKYQYGNFEISVDRWEDPSIIEADTKTKEVHVFGNDGHAIGNVNACFSLEDGDNSVSRITEDMQDAVAIMKMIHNKELKQLETATFSLRKIKSRKYVVNFKNKQKYV